MQSLRDEIDTMILELNELDPKTLSRIAPCASVADFKLKIAKDANNAKALEQKAKVAESKAKAYLTKASTISDG